MLAGLSAGVEFVHCAHFPGAAASDSSVMPCCAVTESVGALNSPLACIGGYVPTLAGLPACRPFGWTAHPGQTGDCGADPPVKEWGRPSLTQPALSRCTDATSTKLLIGYGLMATSGHARLLIHMRILNFMYTPSRIKGRPVPVDC